MFSTAVGVAARYTFPVVSSRRFWDGRIGTSVGAFVAINADGWILTAGHTFNLVSEASASATAIAAHQKSADSLRDNPRLVGKQLADRIRRLDATADKDWITNHSYWWSRDGITLHDLRVIPEADLAIARMEPPLPVDPGHCPIFKDPTLNFGPGSSICRLGFPFASVGATFDATSGTFSFDPRALTFFPSEGMFARTLEAAQKDPDGAPVRFIETSSPGLRGQSGGPILDVFGRIWAIQCQTRTLELGFNPEAKIKGRVSIEPQFISLGIGTHVGTVLSVMRDMGISHTVSPD